MLKHPHQRRDAQFDKRLELWIERRDAAAARLQIEPSIIAARSQLEAVAANEQEGLAQLMRWQRGLLTEPSAAKSATA